MSEILNEKELIRLKELGEIIIGSLECDINDTGVPCRTDRFNAINHMKEYLEIHNYKVEVNTNG